jgi:hypothetical protein
MHEDGVQATSAKKKKKSKWLASFAPIKLRRMFLGEKEK